MGDDYDVLRPDELMADNVREEFGDELEGATIGEGVDLAEVVAMIRKTGQDGGV